ncbi:MAG TPA: tetratricopeptide repeat protein [Humisphaera sp.]|jgi:Tfp pilus assembly protein PilF|nr:tetratricopeptide repeat protein [Humisphaera sp.]
MPQSARKAKHGADDRRLPPRGSLCWGPRLLLLIPIALVGILVFSPLFSAQFTEWDDLNTVAKNPDMLAPASQIGSFWTNLAHPNGDLYLPVTQTIWYALAQIARSNQPDAHGSMLSASVFHTANVLLHALNACLVYLLLMRLVRRSWAAAGGAMLYLLHPLQVEAVGWVSGMKDVLSATFSLIAIYGFVRFLEISSVPFLSPPSVRPARASEGVRARDHHSTQPPPQRPGVPREGEDFPPSRRAGFIPPWLWYCVGIAAFILAMLSKPSAVTTPAIALILGAAWLCRHLASAQHDDESKRKPFFESFIRKILLPLIPWFLLAIPVILEGHRVQPALDVPNIPFHYTPAIAGDALGFDLGKVWLPIWLCIDYGRTPTVVIESGAVYWTWIFAAIPLALAIWWARRRPLLSAGLFIFFVAPLPVLGFVKFEFQHYSTVADHYLYLAMLGPALFLAVLLNYFQPKNSVGIGAAILIPLAILSVLQTAHWKDDYAIFAHAAEVNPRSIAAHPHLAKILAARGETGSAAHEYTLALKLAPDGPTHFNYGNLLFKQGRYDEAIEQYLESAVGQPPSANLQYNLGLAYLKLGKIPPAKAALAEAIRIRPNYADPHFMLALILNTDGDTAGAIEHLQRARQIDPTRQDVQAALSQLGK